MISGLFTGLLGFGGVQRVGQHVAVVLQKIAQDAGSTPRILSLTDPKGTHRLTVHGSTFIVRGFGYQRIRFAFSALASLTHSEIVYIAHPNLAPLALLAKFLRPKARYVVATHGVEVWKPLSTLQRWAVQSAYRITTPSTFTAEQLKSFQKVDPAKVIVVPWAVEPGLLVAKKASSRPPNLPLGKLLLTVGRMSAAERLKGIDTVICALPKILRAVPETSYVVVGEGDDRKRLESLAKELGVQDRVVFVGRIEDGDDLIGYYDACDVFVMPSSQEGFGLVFVEAMARCKPVIGAAHGGTTDIVMDNVTGLLVGYGESERFAELAVRLLLNPQLCIAMGQAGRQRVEAHFKFEQLEVRLRQVMDQPDIQLPIKDLQKAGA